MGNEQNNTDSLSSTERAFQRIPGAELSEDEADEMFESVWEEASAESSSDSTVADVVSMGREQSSSFSRVALAASVLLAIGAGIWLAEKSNSKAIQPDKPQKTYLGTKGAGNDVPKVDLRLYLGQKTDGNFEIIEDLDSGSAVGSNRHILFRYELAKSSHLALLGEGQESETPEVLWRSEDIIPPGESELTANKRAISLKTNRCKGTMRLAMVAGSASELDSLNQLSSLTEKSIQKRCRNYGISIVYLERETKK